MSDEGGGMAMDTARDAFKYLWTSSGAAFSSCVAACCRPGMVVCFLFLVCFVVGFIFLPNVLVGGVCDRRLLVCGRTLVFVVIYLVVLYSSLCTSTQEPLLTILSYASQCQPFRPTHRARETKTSVLSHYSSKDIENHWQWQVAAFR